MCQSFIYDEIFLTQNDFPMKEWHVEHMEKTIVKFVMGLSETGTLTNVCRQIDYDIKHGVTTEQVLSLLHKIRNHSSFSTLLANDGSIERLNELDKHFMPLKEKSYRY
jgi:hypothetical protein